VHKKLKVLFLDQDYEFGGAQNVLLDFLGNIPDKKIDAYIVTCNHGKLLKGLNSNSVQVRMLPLSNEVIGIKREDIRLASLFLKSFQIFFYILRLTKYVVKERIDIIYSNTLEMHIIGSLSSFLGLKSSFWRMHDIVSVQSSFSKFSILLVKVFGFLFPKKILCVSNAVKDSLAKLSIPEKKLEKVYNGIKLANADVSELRSELNIKDDTIVFGWMGRITQIKSPDLFIKAAAKLKEKINVDCKFVIVGEAIKEEEEYYRNLQKLSVELDLKDSVCFYGYSKEPLSLMKAFDIFVHTTDFPDSLPNVILEAMSCEKPVIASEVGGVKEIIKNNENGIIYNAGEIDSLTDAMQYLIDNPKERNDMGINGYEKLQELFDFDKYILEMEDRLLNIKK
jgi:glycosyltransferase involved in cell wall biosynthesis